MTTNTISILLASSLIAACGGDRSTPTDAGTRDAPPAATCESIGGTCGCAGGCGAGLVADPDMSLCPQPCATCGACSQECCVPLDAGTPVDAGTPTDAGTPADGGAACASPPIDRAACTGEGSVCAVADGCCACAIVGACSPTPAWYCQTTDNDPACPADAPTVGEPSCSPEGLTCRYCTPGVAIARICTRVGWSEESIAICR